MNENLLDKLPEISRARSYRLYCSNGKRIVDLYQDGGRAIMGHRVPGLLLSMKQALEKGMFFPCHTRYDKRLENAVHTLAGGDVSFSICSFGGDVPGKLGIGGIDNTLTDSISVKTAGDAVYWYPFSGDSIAELLENYRFVIPVLPFPGTFSPYIILSRTGTLPDKDPVSPAVISSVITVIYRLVDFMKTDPCREWKGCFKIIEKYWRIKGPYLIPLYSREMHNAFFIFLLGKGYLISPVYENISILPAEVSAGEKAGFLNALSRFSEGVLD